MTELPAWRSTVTVAVIHPRAAQVSLHRGTDAVLRFDHDDYVWFPDVAPVLALLRRDWNIDAVVLRCLAFRTDNAERRSWVAFLVQPRTAEMPDDGRWLPITDVDSTMAMDADVWPLVSSAIHEATDPLTPVRRPWAVRGWFEEAVAWSEAALRAHGFEPIGPPEQLRTWSLSTVIRFDTSVGNVYFKAAVFSGPDANGFLFANEAALLSGLSERFPEHLPVPFAVDPQRVWMLLPEAGAFLGKANDAELWERAIRLHARHQRAYAGQSADLFRIGCLDRRLERLAAQFDDLLRDDVALAYLDEADRERLHAAAPRLRAIVAELANLGIPDTLVHGDLHAGNIGVRDGHITYFDWTDGCVAHPFLDLVTFTGESTFLDANPGARDRLHAAYLDEWRDLAPEPALARAAALIAPIGAIHQAVSYQHMLPNLDDPDRSSMGRGGAFWLRTAAGVVSENASL